MKNGYGCFVLALSLVIGCSGGDGKPIEAAPRGALQAAAPEDVESGTVSVRSTPGAACVLRPEGDTDPSHVLRLYADYEGTVRFVATRRRHSGNANASLDCEKGEQKTALAIDMNSGSLFQSPPPATTTLPHTTRAALKAAPDSLTQQQLLVAGYPPRPDGRRNPAAYERWLRAVSVETKVVDPGLVADPSGFHGTGQSSTSYSSPWAAAELNAPVTYMYSFATWSLPGIAYDNQNALTEVAFWTGLGGGTGGGDSLMQDGVTAISLNWSSQVATAYQLWTEYFPTPPSNITTISPGRFDTIDAWTWTSTWDSDGSGPETANGQYACFQLEDATQGLSTKVCNVAPPTSSTMTCSYRVNSDTYTAPCPIPFIAATAEFAVEADNDGNGNQIAALANYGRFTMYGFAVDTNDNWRDFGTDPVVTDILYAKSNAAVVSSDGVQFTWTGTGF